MPGLLKKTFFSMASILSIASAVLIIVALSTQQWVTGSILCKTGAELVNASDPEMNKFIGEIYYGLFEGRKIRQCGLGRRQTKIYMFPNLVRKLNGALHVFIILFLFITITFALVSFGFCVYNARKIPYQSIKGPAGIYLWNLIAGLFGVFGVVSFIAALKLHRLTERIANFNEHIFQFVALEEHYGFSFWLCVASTATHGVNFLVVAITGIHFPKMQKKQPEEPTVTGEDLLY
ncbi:clarin-2 [Erpetoichthys calabaricus]|uniref:clarin-2 n=1 Tax=Erpetoichthys calabaricus TaxID=27687 RepID=UPI0022349C13|nr:clarin-2 [Erpetoichthys calabaricus]